MINEVIDSGYTIRDIADPFSGKTWAMVSDKMFGSKQSSGLFDVDDFVEYIQGNNIFPNLSEFSEYSARNYDDIANILSDPRRQRYINEGKFHFVVKHRNIPIRGRFLAL
ncbi:hypothetical protein GTU79_16870 [Sodalis ligni]|uniref:hypothetical protein n=1 Tax=Sodalis ligni TaxID=2697027 RepID=UPI001BDE2A49|nr:hypothetical protein [Sodalis ligni]QWA09134.1 hypothetical protein GTU79_16870 [Sodalis ligni]